MQHSNDVSENTKEFNSNLFTVKQWAATHNYPSESGLRALIFNARKNGFDRVIKRIGGRILISERDFFAWVEDIQVKEVHYAE